MEPRMSCRLSNPVYQVSYIPNSLSFFKVKFIEVPFTYSKAHSLEAYR